VTAWILGHQLPVVYVAFGLLATGYAAPEIGRYRRLRREERQAIERAYQRALAAASLSSDVPGDGEMRAAS
jgi:hypothetical protein